MASQMNLREQWFAYCMKKLAYLENTDLHIILEEKISIEKYLQNVKSFSPEQFRKIRILFLQLTIAAMGEKMGHITKEQFKRIKKKIALFRHKNPLLGFCYLVMEMGDFNIPVTIQTEAHQQKIFLNEEVDYLNRIWHFLSLRSFQEAVPSCSLISPALQLSNLSPESEQQTSLPPHLDEISQQEFDEAEETYIEQDKKSSDPFSD